MGNETKKLLFGLILSAAIAFAGATFTAYANQAVLESRVARIETTLERHEPATLDAKYDEILRRLDRIERRLDR